MTPPWAKEIAYFGAAILTGLAAVWATLGLLHIGIDAPGPLQGMCLMVLLIAGTQSLICLKHGWKLEDTDGQTKP